VSSAVLARLNFLARAWTLRGAFSEIFRPESRELRFHSLLHSQNMAVVIRLKRTGRAKRPCFRISVADSRSPRDGRTLETLGVYDPVTPVADKQTTLNVERARHWIGAGALPSETVRSIFSRMGVFEGEFAPKHTVRKRPGRKAATKTGARRAATKSARGEKKVARSNERSQTKRAAAKAAAAASDSAE
jgi:small subunit ribosomal protein S16